MYMLGVSDFGVGRKLPNIITTCYDPLRDFNVQGGVAQFESRLSGIFLFTIAGGVCVFYM